MPDSQSSERTAPGGAGLRGGSLDEQGPRGHHEVMTRVGIAELKGHLSRYLREANAGTPVEVLDRGRPVARLVPAASGENGLVVRPAVRRLKDVKLPPPIRCTVDLTAALFESRQNER